MLDDAYRESTLSVLIAMVRCLLELHILTETELVDGHAV
jgi:hypothetical protein